MQSNQLPEPTRMVSSASAVDYKLLEPVSDQELNKLFSASWPNHHPVEFQAVLRQSMAYVCGYLEGNLVGYVNAAWDGKSHAFILDTTVHPSHRRQGIGKELVVRAIEQARIRGVAWVHVDYEPKLKGFYASCGFRPSEAGVFSIASEATNEVSKSFQYQAERLCEKYDGQQKIDCKRQVKSEYEEQRRKNTGKIR